MQRHAGKTRESREASKVRAEAAEEKPAARLQTREGKKRECGRAKDESKLRRGGRNGSINSTFLSHSTKVVLESKGVLTLGLVASYPNTTIATPSLALTDTVINVPGSNLLQWSFPIFYFIPFLPVSISSLLSISHRGMLVVKVHDFMDFVP